MTDSGRSPAVAPFAPFRPRRGRAVPLVMAAAALTVCAAVAVGMGSAGGWRLADQLALVGFGAAIGAFLLRYASIRAVPDDEGLTVRNLLVTRRVEWGDIVQVRFPDGAPWASVELDDTEELAVMAIQRVDGEVARSEAHRLAGLVSQHRRDTRG